MKICFFGDWHKNNNYAYKALHRQRIQRGIPDKYVHLGDFGIYPNSRFLSSVNLLLQEQNTEMWVVPGNHENYDYLATFPQDERGLISLGSNLFALPRGYKWQWHGVRFAALGGAFSIDRPWGRKNVHWWDEELITEEEFQKTIAGDEAIDILVSHEAPWLSGAGIDWKLSRWQERTSKRQRDYIAKTIVQKQVKLNLHGHHHHRYSRMLGACEVQGLSEDGKSIEANSFVLDLEEFRKTRLESRRD